MANQQNVLVKLSAEGEEQVVNAFAKMAEGAKKHGKESETALGSIKNAAAELGKTLVGLFALERVVHGFGELVKGAIDTGEQLARLHAQTGIGTDSLQAYAFAARQAGVDGDAMTTAMTRLARAIFAAQNGSAGAANALSALGLHVRDFIGLTPEQQFDKVARALGTMEDHTKAQAAAQLLMGRGAAQLLPVFRQVAEEGIGAYVERLKQLGIYQSPELIAQFKQVAERLKDVKSEAAGLAVQFTSGLAPAIVNTFAALEKATSGPGVDGFKRLGELIGTVVKGILLGFIAIGTWAGVTAASIVKDFSDAFAGLGEAWERVKARDFSGAAGALGGIFGKFSANKVAAEQQIRDVMAAAWADLNKSLPQPAAEAAPAGLGDLDEGSALGGKIAKAREQLTQQLLDNELAAYKAQAAEREALDKDALAEGLLTLEQYFDDRAQIINERATEEIEVLRKKRAAAAAVPIDEDDQVKALTQRRELAKLDGEIAAITTGAEKELASLQAERFALEKRNADAQEKAEEALAKLRGDHLTAQRAQLERNLAELDRTLAAGGVSGAGRTSAVDTARAQGTAVIDFGEAARTAKQQFTDLTLAIDKVKQAQSSGDLFPIQAEQQILEIERARIPQLQSIVDEMTRLAAATRDAALAEQAKQAQERIDALKVSTNQAGTELAKLKGVAQATFVDGLSNAIVETINNTKKAGDAFRAFGLQLAQAIEQAIVKMLVLKALQSIGGFAGGGAVAAPAGKAEGGSIAGIGNTDSVPIMATPGEFIVKKDAASQPGMRMLLEAINGGVLRGKPTSGVQHFAEGGFVATGAAAAPQIKVVNVLDPSVLGDHLATAPGEQSVINIMARHPNRIREALG